MKTFKKILSLAVVAAMSLSVFGCANNDTAESEAAQSEDVAVDAEYISYAEYEAADLDTEVTVLCTVMATQSWWEDTINVYAADQDGAYFIYEMECSEEDAANLTAGTTILVTGYKSEWEVRSRSQTLHSSS
jgi:hypothetical protein